MKNIEDLLKERKCEFDDLEVPQELESRLRNVLDNQKDNKNKRKLYFLTKIAAIFMVIVIASYHVNTLAYYSRKLIGYDNIMGGTLSELNELGKGQVIDATYTFKNGVSITIDGIMIDEGQLIAFYRIEDPRGLVDKVNLRMVMESHRKDYIESGGVGEVNDTNTEMKWVSSFEAPGFFANNLTFRFHLLDDENPETGEITFKIDRNKAMKANLKKRLNKKIRMNETQIKIDDIVASPTQTIVNGSVQSRFQLAMDHIRGKRIRPYQVNMKLVADGKELQSQASSLTTDTKGIHFEQRFDTLPTDLETLEIHIISLSVDADVEETFNLNKSDQQLIVKGQEVIINHVEEKDGNTYVTITTDETVTLSRVVLLIDDDPIALKETTTLEHVSHNDGSVAHKRTLRFPATGKNKELMIKSISFTEDYNVIIPVPVK